MASFPGESNAQSNGVYLNNLVSEAQYLMSQGYSRAAAAGIAGTTAGESGGNPESVGSGGAGLIGWTPPSSAHPYSNIVTGNAQQDFNHQLVDLVNYANSNSAEAVARGGVNLAQLKAATDPVQAASWWSAFEGPLVPGSDVRSGVATQVYDALGGYKPNSGYTAPVSSTAAGSTANATQAASTSGGTTCLGVTLPSWLGGGCVGKTVPSLASLENDLWGYLERAGLFLLGGIFIVMGLYIMVKDTGAAKNVTEVVKAAPEAAAVV